MKRTLFTLILLYFFAETATYAQVEKNNLFFTGSANIGFNAGTNKSTVASNTTKYSYCNFKLYDQAGYTVIKHLPVGIFVNLNLYGDKDKSDGSKYHSTDFAIGPFVRYYIANFNDLMPYVEGLIGGGVSNTKNIDSNGNDYTYKESYFTYRVGGGATYFLTDYLGFDLFLGFNHDAYNHKATDTPEKAVSADVKNVYNEFMFTLGIVVSIPK